MGAILRKYGAATTILFPLVDAGTMDFESTPVTMAAGDFQISKDEGAFANTDTTTATHEGNGIYSLPLTATEMQAARIVITAIDQTATKLWEDQAILIETYGNASAQHAFDLDTAIGDVYQAKVVVVDDDSGGADRYLVSFFKNGAVITSGVTVPTLWVYSAAASPANLVGTSGSPQSLTEAGSTETWFHNESTNRIADGTGYIARVRFTVDGAEREWPQPIGRDSSA